MLVQASITAPTDETGCQAHLRWYTQLAHLENRFEKLFDPSSASKYVKPRALSLSLSLSLVHLHNDKPHHHVRAYAAPPRYAVIVMFTCSLFSLINCVESETDTCKKKPLFRYDVSGIQWESTFDGSFVPATSLQGERVGILFNLGSVWAECGRCVSRG